MPAFKDLTGQVFGRLKVVSRDFTKKPRSYWNCICRCGNSTVTKSNALMTGNTKSCGCLIREITKSVNTKHGYKNTRTYSTWQGMKNRCLNTKADDFHHYGGRGITVCESWAEDFTNFLTDMGERPEGRTLDRVDNSKGYYKENCKWATNAEQHKNKRTTHLLTYQGKTQSLKNWADEIGISQGTLGLRILKCKWTIEKALTEPIRRSNRN